MSKALVDDRLWEIIEPLIPVKARRTRNPGRKRLDNRKVLTGILFVLKTGIAWEDLPQEMGCGSGMSCWRRLHEWQEAGVWEKLHKTLLEKLQESAKIDWTRSAVDSSSVRAILGAKKPGQTRLTEPNRGRNTTLLRMRRAFRSL